MKPVKVRLAVGMAFSLVLSVTALAAPYTVQISEVEWNNNSLYIDATGNPEPAIVVRGTFTPTSPCVQEGFFLAAGDPFFNETIAILLSAKATGAPVGFTFVYCHATGCARGNTFSIQ